MFYAGRPVTDISPYFKFEDDYVNIWLYLYDWLLLWVEPLTIEPLTVSMVQGLNNSILILQKNNSWDLWITIVY